MVDPRGDEPGAWPRSRGRGGRGGHGDRYGRSGRTAYAHGLSRPVVVHRRTSTEALADAGQELCDAETSADPAETNLRPHRGGPVAPSVRVARTEGGRSVYGVTSPRNKPAPIAPAQGALCKVRRLR